MWCCKAQSNLAGQARDRLCQTQQQLFTRSDPPINGDLPLSSLQGVSDARSSWSQQRASGSGLAPALDGAGSDGTRCRTSMWRCCPCHQPGGLLQPCPSGREDTPLHLCDGFRCDLPSDRAVVCIACRLWLTTLSTFVPCPALGPGEAMMLPCHLKLWRRNSCS